MMKLTIAGCGDAFGSGGRFNTCFHAETADGAFLVDCGASSLIALRTAGLDPNGVRTIFITHLHGDHFGGLVWFLLDARVVSKRTGPLTLAGPPRLGKRLEAAMEALFPGSSKVELAFDMEVIELEREVTRDVNGVTVTPYEVRHPAGATPFALRLEAGGKTLAFTGDTEWTDSLIPAGRDADLFIMECYQFDRKLKFHLNYRIIEEHLDEIGPRRVLLTHMSEAMLARRTDVDGGRFMLAEDGMVIDL